MCKVFRWYLSSLISCLLHKPTNPSLKCTREVSVTDIDENIILNPQFDDVLKNWSGRGCNITLNASLGDGKILPQSGKVFAATTNRTQTWNGIQQEITGRVQRKWIYEATAVVRIYGNNITSANVHATLWMQNPDKREQYVGVASVQATDSDWAQLQGKFYINGSPSRVVIYGRLNVAGIWSVKDFLQRRSKSKVMKLLRSPQFKRNLEPFIRKLIREEFNQALHLHHVPLQRSVLYEAEQSATRSFWLCFACKIPNRVFACNQIEAEPEGTQPLKVVLQDAKTGALVSEGPLSSTRLQIVVLFSGFKM